MEQAIDTNAQANAYKVVVNSEEQYAIWPFSLYNPAGWRDAGKHGTKEECLDFVRSVWTDLTPRSLRQS